MEGQLSEYKYTVKMTPYGVWPASEKRTDTAWEVVSWGCVVFGLAKASNIPKVGLIPNIYKAPKIFTNSRGQLTNGVYILDDAGMAVHKTGSLVNGKSQFFYSVDAESIVLDAAAYADEYNLWKPNTGNLSDFANKAKIPIVNGNIGVHGSGEVTNYVTVMRTKTGFVHGFPSLGN